MNKCYRLVFDEARGFLIPIAEHSSARRKGRGRAQSSVHVSTVALLVASFGSLCGPFLTARASGASAVASQFGSILPTGGHVVAGTAAILNPSADQMVIEQSTARAAIDWQSFNIGSGDAVQFVQPSSSAQTLNRVVGMTGTTQILGKLTANGQVFIVNPQGVVFGKGAVVDTAALLASTHDIAPRDFMTHGTHLLLTGSATDSGLVDNEGTLNTTPGGWIALIGRKVSNGGSINAPGGTVALAAGDEATLTLMNGQLVSVQLAQPAANAGVTDNGTIRVIGTPGIGAGRVLISADTAQRLLAQAINITGIVQAGSTNGSGGQIAIDAGPNGAVALDGATLTVDSTQGIGGAVNVSGAQVTLYDAKVSATGAAGAGTIIANGVHGGVVVHGSAINVSSSEAHAGTAVLSGSTVSVLDGSRIDASGARGGGTVIIGGDRLGKVAGLMCVSLASRTVVDGSSQVDISSAHGNGGFLETSGKSVEITGSVNAHAQGASGQWLIDPNNLIITNSGSSTATYTSNSWSPVTGGGGSYVLDSALNGANVTLYASGDIYSDSNVVINDPGYNVTLIANNVGLEGSWTANNIIFNQSATGGILGAVTGNVVAESGTLNDYSSGTISGSITVDSGAVFSVYTNSSLSRSLRNDFILSGGTIKTAGVDGIATGGTLTRSNGIDAINIFDANGSLNTSAWSGSKSTSYLLVGGGGGGGQNWGGGGGAGGVLQGSATVSDGVLQVNVGAGGTGAVGFVLGGNGGNTTFNGLTADGGGGGAQATSNLSLINGAGGGSGGGGVNNGLIDGSGGPAVVGQGNPGGIGIPTDRYPLSAGGGGAGAPGSNASSTSSGAGGIGIQSSLVGADTYYAGGGGGGGYYCATVNRNYGFGLGGLGGGGNGVKDARSNGLPGEANTGGGGGGGAGSSGAGGAGGSGIAVIASSIAGTSDATSTGNTSVTLTGGITLTGGANSILMEGSGGAHLAVNGIVSGSGGLTDAGPGTLTLTADNSYAGATTILGGTLQVGVGGTTGTLGSGAVTDDAALLVNYAKSVNLSAIAACSTGITGTGSFTAMSTGSLGIDRPVNLSAGNTSVFLAAGTANAAGTAGGGDVTITAPLSVGAKGSITIFSGNPNTSTLDAQLFGASAGTQYKTYDSGYGATSGSITGTRNFYYRSTEDIVFTGTVSASKTYDGSNSAVGWTTIGNAGVSQSTPDGNNLSVSDLKTLTETFNSPHALGPNGSVVTLTFGSTAIYSDAGANWSVAGLTVNPLYGRGTIMPATLTVTANSSSKTYDGTTQSNALATISGLASTDTLAGSAYTEQFLSAHAIGDGESILGVAAALSNASFATGSVGEITDYHVVYQTAQGTISPAVLDIASGTNFSLYDLPTATLAQMTGNVSAGAGYVSDYMPNIVNNGNLTFAGPNPATLISLTGTGTVTVGAGQRLTVTGIFRQASEVLDGYATLLRSGSSTADLVSQVQSSIGTSIGSAMGSAASNQSTSESAFASSTNSPAQADTQSLDMSLVGLENRGKSASGSRGGNLAGSNAMPQNYSDGSRSTPLCIHPKKGANDCT